MAQVVVFEGPVAHIGVDPQARTVEIEASDGWGKPGDTKLSTTVYQGKRTGDLVGVILDAIGWPAADRSIDAGVTVVPYWWVEGVDAATAVNDLVHSEGPPAVAYVNNGIFTFRDRHHRVTRATSLTTQGTYTHKVNPPGSGPAGSHKIIKDTFRYDHGLDYIINSATIEVAPWLPGSFDVVWSTDDPLALSPNEVVTLVIRADTPFLNLQSPSPTPTLDPNGEVVYAGDYHLAQGSVSFGLSRTSGQSAFLTVTAGGSGALLDLGLRVRGTPLSQGAARKFTAADPASQKTYGNADWDGSAPWAHYYDAEAIVDRVVAIYATPQPSVVFDVEARLDPVTLTRILATQISDRITVRDDETGLNEDFMVEQLTHTVYRLGIRHTLTIGAQVVEPYQADNPITFDVAGTGFNLGQFSMDTGMNPATMFRFDVTGQGFNQGFFSL